MGKSPHDITKNGSLKKRLNYKAKSKVKFGNK